MQTIDNSTRIGEIVADDYRTAAVFKKYGIDFCCGGGRTVKEACTRQGVEVEAVLEDLTALERSAGGPAVNYQDWDQAFLVDYIVNKHHLYVRSKLPELQAFADKVSRVHGERHPETIQIARLWRELSTDLLNHMAKEEQILFPYIKKLVKGKKEPNPAITFGTVRNPIHMMELEHDLAGEMMRQIRELTGDYTPPSDACTTYRVLYSFLEEFEENLHEHVHLENNILFPRAIELEQRS